MKPCFTKRKPIALLALGELDAHRTPDLRAHLETCAGCRCYLEEISALKERVAAADTMADIQASETFHRRLAARLRAEQPKPLWDVLAAQLAVVRLSWRVALPVIGVAALALVTLSILLRPPAVSAPGPRSVQAGRQPHPETDLSPTIANYQRAASRSLEALDELLTMQANRKPSPAPIYTASMSAAVHALD
jgi:anti-sigma factor RsiW